MQSKKDRFDAAPSEASFGPISILPAWGKEIGYFQVPG